MKGKRAKVSFDRLKPAFILEGESKLNENSASKETGYDDDDEETQQQQPQEQPQIRKNQNRFDTRFGRRVRFPERLQAGF